MPLPENGNLSQGCPILLKKLCFGVGSFVLFDVRWLFGVCLGYFVCVCWCFENKWCKGNHSPSSMGRPKEIKWLASPDLLSPFSLLSMSSYGMEYFWFVWDICLVVSTPKPLHAPGCGAQWEKAALALWKCCSAIATTSVCCQPCFGDSSKQQSHRNCYEDSLLRLSQTQYTMLGTIFPSFS